MPFIATTANASIRAYGLGSSSSLYKFTSHTFTPAGKIGQFGPTTAQLQTAYSSAEWAQNTNFLISSNGVQLWTVPKTSTYLLTVAGARGESGNSYGSGLYGGSGAILTGRVTLKKGTQVSIVVGQIGMNGGSGRGGGGGGGSFVYTGSIGGNGLIMAAGGGGGGDDTATQGVSANSDLQPRITSGGVQLNNGQSGIGGYSDGAGWLEEGQNYPGNYDGQRWQGGNGNPNGYGGFGGGSGDIDDGGSGGGFTGGSGTSAAGGGAGGSFYAGMSEPDTSYTSIYTVTSYSWGGLNTSNGYVTIQAV